MLLLVTQCEGYHRDRGCVLLPGHRQTAVFLPLLQTVDLYLGLGNGRAVHPSPRGLRLWLLQSFVPAGQ